LCLKTLTSTGCFVSPLQFAMASRLVQFASCLLAAAGVPSPRGDADAFEALSLLQMRMSASHHPTHSDHRQEHSFELSSAQPSGFQDETSNGTMAKLSSAGYKLVAASGSRVQMYNFVKRVLAQENLVVENEGDLQGMLPYYSGECRVQSYHALVKELRAATEDTHCRSAWITSAPQSLLLEETAHTSRKQRQMRASSHTEIAVSTAGLHLGLEVQLNEHGYRSLVATRNSTEMQFFIRRVVEDEGFAITDNGAVAPMSKFHSGECDSQSFKKLVKEVREGVARKPLCGGPWLAPVEE